MWLERAWKKLTERNDNDGDKAFENFSLTQKLRRARITVVTSGKGGVGKTTIATGLSTVLAMSGRHTLIVDMDTGLRNMDLVLGVEDRIAYNLYDVVSKRVHWTKAAFEHPSIPNLYVVVSDQSRSKEAIHAEGFEKFLFQAAKYFDNVILDCPAGIEYGFDLATQFVDDAIVVATPEAPSLRGAAQVVRILEKRKIAFVEGVLNRVYQKLADHDLSSNMEETEKILGIPVRVAVPMEHAVLTCSHQGMPYMISGSVTAKQSIEQFAERFFDIEISNEEKQSFFGR